MPANNYKVSFNTDPQLYFEKESLMPYYKTNIEVKVLIDPQHDGHLWPKMEVENMEIDLAEEILKELRPKIFALVSKTKPFAIHV